MSVLNKILSFRVLVVVFLFFGLQVMAQDYSVTVKVNTPVPTVHIKLYRVIEPFQINALNTSNYIGKAKSIGNNEYKIEGVLDTTTTLYRLNILRHDNINEHVNTPLSTLFLKIEKGDCIFISVDRNDYFDEYNIENSEVNKELKTLFELKRKLVNNDSFFLNNQYCKLIENTKYPEVFYVAISDSITKNLKSLSRLNNIPIIGDRIKNDFSEFTFSKQLNKFMTKSETNSNHLYYFFLLIIFLLIISFLMFKYIEKRKRSKDENLFYSLSQREKIILNNLDKFQTNKELADDLCIQYSTLKKHLSNIYKKIKVNNKSEALSFIRKMESALNQDE